MSDKDMTVMNKLATAQQCLDYLDITSNQWGHSKTGPVILELIEKYDIKSFVEVGAQTCYLSELIAKAFPSVQIFCIDLNHHRPALSQRYETITLITGDSIESANLFENNSVDMTYIDVYKTDDVIKRNLIAWYPKTKRILSGHDYQHSSFPNTTRDINEYAKDRSLHLNTGDYYNYWMVL